MYYAMDLHHITDYYIWSMLTFELSVFIDCVPKGDLINHLASISSTHTHMHVHT